MAPQVQQRLGQPRAGGSRREVWKGAQGEESPVPKLQWGARDVASPAAALIAGI